MMACFCQGDGVDGEREQEGEPDEGVEGRDAEVGIVGGDPAPDLLYAVSEERHIAKRGQEERTVAGP